MNTTKTGDWKKKSEYFFNYIYIVITIVLLQINRIHEQL